ncbi:hypothetical protein VNO77_04012 [Canavalia gladiata]|uniref:Uncharacterized protein n=1 Tax=Canavalia gladiata TaxID=3824 RepID=A0AAN9MVR4_CANGL
MQMLSTKECGLWLHMLDVTCIALPRYNLFVNTHSRTREKNTELDREWILLRSEKREDCNARPLPESAEENLRTPTP